jgi:phospholipase C
MSITRRDALKRIGGLGALTALPRVLPGCGGGDDAPGIKHYVYLMLENHTYDNVLGARKLMESLPGDGLVAGMQNPDAAGGMVPIHEAAVADLCVPDPPHDWDRSHAQFNGGAMDGFVKQYNEDLGMTGLTQVMEYLTRTHVPVTWALADKYTTCDRWFASVMGPTLPNRAYWHTATSFGLKDNSAVLNKFAAVPVPTIYNRLQDKNIDWVYYFGSVPVAAALGNPGPYQLDLGANDGKTGKIRKFAGYPDDPGDPTGQFFKDCLAGKLPPVTYIDPYFGNGGNDDHPPTHPIMAQSLIAAVYTALAKSPLWKHTMLVITYDEHGGYFDHVPPPMTTDDTATAFGVDGFEQMGFRVPALVIGPYAKKGYVSSVQYDHTSALKELQVAFGLDPLNVRMDMANDLSDCIDMDRLAKGDWEPPIEIPEINIDDWDHNAAGCMATNPFIATDPISEWVNNNPGKLPDHRMYRESYHRAIREFLAKNQGTIGK